jgi:hypothetical protein
LSVNGTTKKRFWFTSTSRHSQLEDENQENGATSLGTEFVVVGAWKSASGFGIFFVSFGIPTGYGSGRAFLLV